MRDRAKFLAAFVRRPLVTGSITPSSVHLAETIVAGMGIEAADTIVELGPGTGVFTRLIHERMKPEARFLCFEVNEDLVPDLRSRFPKADVINDSIENLSRHLEKTGRSSVDVAISGLPWAAFSQQQQQTLLDAAVGPLRKGAAFATFAYSHAAWLPPGQRFRKLLDSRFSRVETSGIVWKNIPPAFVYRCWK
jgi:phospholipid N-methyltransferase